MKNKNLEDLKEFLEFQRRNRQPCPDCRPHCPYCDPAYRRPDPWRESQCILNKPLMMVIPPEGVHLSCPVHPEGHHVFGPAIYWMNQPRDGSFGEPWCEYDSTRRQTDYSHDRNKDLTFDSTRLYGRCTGDNL